MNINKTQRITKNRKGEIWTNIVGKGCIATTMQQIKVSEELLRELRKSTRNEDKINLLVEKLKELFNEVVEEENYKANVKEICEQLINFFKDVEFEPNYRFVNTLKLQSNDIHSAREYVVNYFKISDNPYKDDIQEKVKCQEFKNIVSAMNLLTTTSTINSRFKLYYGSAGTGKTTKALEESSNLCIVCNSSMLPNDLLEDFNFTDGKAGFNLSALARAMEEGQTIVLDEINLLPYESLRFLQGILDNKTEITHKGYTIHIKEGFKIIGTMNLNIGGSIFGLPEPLVDRASELREFKLTAEQLVGALI